MVACLGSRTGKISAFYGPFSTAAQVPSPSFLATNNFSYVGAWNVVGRPCDAFAASAGAGEAGTWYSFDSQTGNLSRIMNVDAQNDFTVAVLGAYYFVNAATFAATSSSPLPALLASCRASARGGTVPSDMVTLLDIETAMTKPPNGSQVACTMADIQALIPGISVPSGTVTPPAWTNRVQSDCFMIGQDTYRITVRSTTTGRSGEQVTVFVAQGTPGVYDSRYDEVLPKGTVGPGVGYSWNGSTWSPACCDPQGGIVPMPVPDFVKAGGGKCRAVITNNPYFGSLTMWSIALSNQHGTWVSNFWDWFDDQQNGVVFSLAPASSLTLIDYQTFVRTPPSTRATSVFDEPCQGLPPCSTQVQRTRAKMRFVPPAS